MGSKKVPYMRAQCIVTLLLGFGIVRCGTANDDDDRRAPQHAPPLTWPLFDSKTFPERSTLPDIDRRLAKILVGESELPHTLAFAPTSRRGSSFLDCGILENSIKASKRILRLRFVYDGATCDSSETIETTTMYAEYGCSDKDLRNFDGKDLNALTQTGFTPCPDDKKQTFFIQTDSQIRREENGTASTIRSSKALMSKDDEPCTLKKRGKNLLMSYCRSLHYISDKITTTDQETSFKPVSLREVEGDNLKGRVGKDYLTSGTLKVFANQWSGKVIPRDSGSRPNFILKDQDGHEIVGTISETPSYALGD